MYNGAKILAYARWHELLTSTENSMSTNQKYDELLRLADEYRSQGIIDAYERNVMIEMATAAYARSIARV